MDGICKQCTCKEEFGIATVSCQEETCPRCPLVCAMTGLVSVSSLAG